MNIKILKIEIFKFNVEITKPIKILLGNSDGAENLAIKVTTDNGIVGWGESSPCAEITGDSQDTNYATAQTMARLIKGKDVLAIEERMKEINSLTFGDPSVRSAFDMALYDIAAKAAKMPLYQFLGGERRELRTDLTIGIKDTVEETVAQTKDIIASGFDAIKLKVGRPELEDVPYVRAVREVIGPEISLKIDSNQGWDYPTAVANINAMQDFNLQYSEQPIAAWDYEGLARLRAKVNLPICGDESVFDHKDAMKLAKMEAVDYLNIKLGKSGGIHSGLKINAIAEAAGMKCMIGCFAESRLGLSAAAHLAMARPNISFIDLDSCYNFKTDPVIGGMTFDDKIGGLLNLSDAIGHGAEFDENHLNQESKVTI
ncbi:MAG: dipeptide epimerase [Saprospiraceae bacterium]|nr:dipeptide epimerase [Saprospiraceae bacterium]|tara:strand:- start:2450 stop:3565 length:1116 start_codon:yes stop_codon:yes gene_type:complete